MAFAIVSPKTDESELSTGFDIQIFLAVANLLRLRDTMPAQGHDCSV